MKTLTPEQRRRIRAHGKTVPKDIAIELLGGTVAEAAHRIGVSKQAIYAWPDKLPPRVGDRVLAACVRWRIKQRIKQGVELEHWELALVS